MNEPAQPAGLAANAQSQAITWAEFLESVPPGPTINITDLYTYDHFGVWVVARPDLQLHCDSESCKGLRFFQCTSDEIYPPVDSYFFFLSYACRNCVSSTKTFAVLAKMVNPYTVFHRAGGGSEVSGGSRAGEASKLGEVPSFGPPTPAKVISLIGPDRDWYIKGRRAELQGLGIGAFAYYRRVVENQKSRIIAEMKRAAERVGVTAEQLASFDAAISETQFSRAIDEVKDAIPAALMVKSHNPLTLLHNALSKGLHAKTDEECLALATSIRVVLTDLAERISAVMKNEEELNQAVSRLLKP